MKNSTYEKFVNVFSWLAYGLTCFLSIYAVNKIFNSPEHYWLIVAIAAGLVVNTTEMLAWYRRNKNKSEVSRLEVLEERSILENNRNEIQLLILKRNKWHPLFITMLMACLSVTGSIFSLQTGYNRGKEIEKVQEAVMKQLALREGVINEHQLNSKEAREQAAIKKRLSNMYLTKSDEFLKKAETMLGANADEIKYLKDNIENKMALSIYNGYSTLLGGNPEYWAILFNILLAVIIESGFLYLALESFYINNPLAYIKELGEREPVVRRKEITPKPIVKTNPASLINIDPEPQIAHANNVQIVAQDVEKKTPVKAQIRAQKTNPKIGFLFAQKSEKESANVQTGSSKKTIGRTFAPMAKNGANKTAKRKQKNNILHRKICFEFMTQQAQIKEGVRAGYNFSEIAQTVQTTRQNVDYHLRKENLK